MLFGADEGPQDTFSYYGPLNRLTWNVGTTSSTRPPVCAGIASACAAPEGRSILRGPHDPRVLGRAARHLRRLAARRSALPPRAPRRVSAFPTPPVLTRAPPSSWPRRGGRASRPPPRARSRPRGSRSGTSTRRARRTRRGGGALGAPPRPSGRRRQSRGAPLAAPPWTAVDRRTAPAGHDGHVPPRPSHGPARRRARLEVPQRSGDVAVVKRRPTSSVFLDGRRENAEMFPRPPPPGGGRGAGGRRPIPSEEPSTDLALAAKEGPASSFCCATSTSIGRCPASWSRTTCSAIGGEGRFTVRVVPGRWTQRAIHGGRKEAAQCGRGFVAIARRRHSCCRPSPESQKKKKLHSEGRPAAMDAAEPAIDAGELIAC